MNRRERWDRVAETVSEVVPVSVSSRTYPGGVSYSIGQLVGPEGRRYYLEIADTWWAKNGDVWTGYEVTLERCSDSIVVATWPRTKKRAEVRAAVRSALAKVQG